MSDFLWKLLPNGSSINAVAKLYKIRAANAYFNWLHITIIEYESEFNKNCALYIVAVDWVATAFVSTSANCSQYKLTDASGGKKHTHALCGRKNFLIKCQSFYASGNIYIRSIDSIFNLIAAAGCRRHLTDARNYFICLRKLIWFTKSHR